MFGYSIRDAFTKRAAKVSSNGELVVGSLSYSETYYASLAVDNDIYSVVPALTKKLFIITGILITTSKDVVGDKTVHIYETTTATSAIHSKDIIDMDMVKSDRIFLPLVNVATQENRFINAHADDSIFNVTIFGYYVDA